MNYIILQHRKRGFIGLPNAGIFSIGESLETVGKRHGYKFIREVDSSEECLEVIRELKRTRL